MSRNSALIKINYLVVINYKLNHAMAKEKDKKNVIDKPLSFNSENHLVPSSLCGPDATFFKALVIDLVPVNDIILLCVGEKYR